MSILYYDYNMVNQLPSKSGIYCIENIANGKKYIGRAINIRNRIKRHIKSLQFKRDTCSYLQRAWNKYGKDGFRFFVIKLCVKDDLNKKEIFYIKKFGTKKLNGYNLTDGGEGNNGWNPSAKIRKNMRDNHWDSSGSNNPMFNVRLFANHHPRFGKKLSNASSKYIGVLLVKANGYRYWQAWARAYGIRNYIGSYKKEIDAARAYDNYVMKNGLPNPLNF